jgi:hypothetical protein
MTDHDPGDEDDGVMAGLAALATASLDYAGPIDVNEIRARLGLPPTGIAWADLPAEEQKRLQASAHRYIDDLFWHQGEPRLS